MQNIKCIVLGSCGVGKTCLLITYTTNSFPGEYIPTVYDHYSANVMVDGRPIQLDLSDSSGGGCDYDKLRPLHYPGTDIFLLCFSIISRHSMQRLKNEFVPEIAYHKPDAPFLIVATKIDLRDDQQLIDKIGSPIQTEEGQKFAQSVGAAGYVEVSALTTDGLKNVFDTAIRASLSFKVGKFPNMNYFILDQQSTAKNHKYWNKYRIYDLKSFIFLLLSICLDIMINIFYGYYVWTTNNATLQQFAWYQFLIIVMPTIFIIFLFYILRLYYFNKCSHLCLYTLFLVTVCAVFGTVGCFSTVPLFFHRCISTKFPLRFLPRRVLKNYEWNTGFWIDIFSFIKCSENGKDYKLRSNVINNQLNLSHTGILTKSNAAELYASIGTESLEMNETYRSFYKFLFYYVYSQLLISFDSNWYIEYAKDVRLIFFGYFYALLFPSYLLTQFSKVVLCIFMIWKYGYNCYYTIVVSLLFCCLICFWSILFKSVLNFHYKMWNIGCDNEFTTIINEKCIKILRDIDKFYKEKKWNRMTFQHLVKMFGNDIANIIMLYKTN